MYVYGITALIFNMKKLRTAGRGPQQQVGRCDLDELAGVVVENVACLFPFISGAVQELGIALDHFFVAVKLGLHPCDLGTDRIRGIRCIVGLKAINRLLDVG